MLYGLTFSFASTKCVLRLRRRPAPEMPDLLSEMIVPASQPARASGASPRITLVG